MGYFPFFVELSGKRGLIVGGGHVALRKVEKLLPYGAKLTLVAPDILPEIAEIAGLRLCRRAFCPGDLCGVDFAIAAAGDEGVNREVSLLCRERNILVNVVDNREECTFLFPSLVHRGSLSVGISTGGASPSAASWLKGQIEALLPGRMEDVLIWLEALRPVIKEEVPNPEKRARLFSKLFSACLEKGRPLSAGELEALKLTPQGTECPQECGKLPPSGR